eukprot:742351-Prymnesium_polylepis.1
MADQGELHHEHPEQPAAVGLLPAPRRVPDQPRAAADGDGRRGDRLQGDRPAAGGGAEEPRLLLDLQALPRGEEARRPPAPRLCLGLQRLSRRARQHAAPRPRAHSQHDLPAEYQAPGGPVDVGQGQGGDRGAPHVADRPQAPSKGHLCARARRRPGQAQHDRVPHLHAVAAVPAADGPQNARDGGAGGQRVQDAADPGGGVRGQGAPGAQEGLRRHVRAQGARQAATRVALAPVAAALLAGVAVPQGVQPPVHCPARLLVPDAAVPLHGAGVPAQPHDGAVPRQPRRPTGARGRDPVHRRRARPRAQPHARKGDYLPRPQAGERADRRRGPHARRRHGHGVAPRPRDEKAQVGLRHAEIHGARDEEQGAVQCVRRLVLAREAHPRLPGAQPVRRGRAVLGDVGAARPRRRPADQGPHQAPRCARERAREREREPRVPSSVAVATPYRTPSAMWHALRASARHARGTRHAASTASVRSVRVVCCAWLAGCRDDGIRSIQRCKFFTSLDWPALDMRKVKSPLRREWYLREPDLTMARQFRNGEDLSRVIEKLQHISLDGQEQPDEESGPGTVPDWDYTNTRAVYDEYTQSPYQNYKSHA